MHMIFVLLYESPMNIEDQLPHETHTAYESGFYKLKVWYYYNSHYIITVVLYYIHPVRMRKGVVK